jgi:phosphoesterase RecJ-like protein
LGRALQNLKVIPEHQTTYTTLTQDELNTFDYVKEILKASWFKYKRNCLYSYFIENKDEKIIKISVHKVTLMSINLHEIIFKVEDIVPLVENQKCRWKKQ